MLRTVVALLAAVSVATCLILVIDIRNDLGELQEDVIPGEVHASDGEGLRGEDGQLILGPAVEGNDENQLAVSLAVGLQRSDGLLFGEFAKGRRAKMCPGSRTGGFARVWFGGEQRYSIVMSAADTQGAGCGERLVIAEVDWRNARVVAPSDNSGHGQPVPWLQDFRAGDEP